MEVIAYTWFNRLVALRYMEIHDYLDHGYRVLNFVLSNKLDEIAVRFPHLFKEGGVVHGLDEMAWRTEEDASAFREVFY